jgi:TP901 family phage tail tape measure protein
MAGDTNSNIFINIDTSQAMAQLRALEKEITALNRALIVGTKTATQAQSKYAQSLLHNVNATGQWTASMTRMKTATEQFATALDKSKLSLKEYFRYGVASTRTFGRVFGNEFDTVSKLVDKRVKTLQQQYVQLGRDAQGAMNALKFTPKALNYRDVTTQLMLATQRQQIFNKLMDDGATKLLNFGKNTQWAGRQLMVGFTIPLAIFGTQAIRTFKEIETQVIRFKKVYGDIFTDQGATDQALKNIRELGDEYTKYGLKVADTIKTAADAAAAGFSGKGLENLVEQTNKLAVLGGVTQEKALETTIALRNAFQIDESQLSGTIDFLNAVENQTVVALEDLTEAVPRVAPVIQQLGGDVKDLAYFMAAMQEGGISAAQGANALKSGLASLINPSKAAAAAASDLGINLKGIIQENQGNLRNIVTAFAKSLQPLTDLQRTQIIEKIFGKYQFARISALLNNIGKEGTQAARVLQLTNASAEELAILSKRELKIQADSPMNKLAASIEKLKVAIAPIGKLFAEILTPVLEYIGKIAEKFNNLPDGIKKAIAIIIGVVGGIGPIFLMTFGLIANAVANSLKGVNMLRKGYQQLAYGSSDVALKTQYLTQEELENVSITNALYSKHEQLSAAYRLEQAALSSLIGTYSQANVAMGGFAANNPGLFLPGRGKAPKRFADGTTSVPGPRGAGDVVPSMLSPGEAVIPAKQSQKYSGFISQIIQDKVPGFATGINPFARTSFATNFDDLMFGAARSTVQATGGSRKTPLLPVSVPGRSAAGFKSLFGTEAKGLSNILYREQGDDLIIQLKDVSFSIPKASKKDLKIALQKNERFLTMGDPTRTAKHGRTSTRKGESWENTTEGKLYYLLKVRSPELQGRKITRLSDIYGRLQKWDTLKNRVGKQSVAEKRWKEILSRNNPNAIRLMSYYENEEKAILQNNLERLRPGISSRLNWDKKDTPSHLTPVGKKRGKASWTEEKIARDWSWLNLGLRGTSINGVSGAHPVNSQQALQIIRQLDSLTNISDSQLALREALRYRVNRQPNTYYDEFKFVDKDILGLAGGILSVPGPRGAGDIQPAMLSPGEAVIPARQSAKYAPLISSIMSDRVPGFIEGNDPAGYRQTPSGLFIPNKSSIEKETKAAAASMSTLRKVTTKLANSFKGTDIAANNASEALGKDKTRGFTGFLRGYGGVANTVTDEATGQQRLATPAERTNMRQLNRMNFTQRAMPLQMVGMAAPMAAGMYAQKNPDSAIAKSMDLIMMISMLTMLLPMLNSPLKMLAATAVGLIAVFKAQASTIKNNIVEGQKQAESMTMTTKRLEELGSITGKVSITQVAAAQRAGRTTEITPVSMEFGQNIIRNSDFGKSLAASFNQTMSTFGAGTAAESLSNQLATAVSQGILDAAQAESIAVALTRDLKDARLELDVRGRLIQLLGPNGENLVNDPLKVQVELIASGQRMQEAAIKNLNMVGMQQRGINRSEALQLGGAAIPAAGLGIYAGMRSYNAMQTAQSIKSALSASTELKAASGAGKLKTALNVAKGARVAIQAGSAAAAVGTGGVAGVPALISAALGTIIFGGVEAALRSWQKGKEKAAVGKAAGQLQGIVTQNLAASQQGIDALNAQFDSAINNLELKKKIAKTEKERSDIDDQIAGLEEKRQGGLRDIRQAQAKMLSDAAGNLDKISGQSLFERISPLGSGRGAVRDKYMEAFRVGMKEKFKDNAGLAAEASVLQDTLDKMKDDKLTIKISTLVTSDVLTPNEASVLLSTLTKAGMPPKKTIDTIVKTQGTEGLQRLSTVLTLIPGEKNKKDLVVDIASKNKAQADATLAGLEEIIKIPEFIGISIDLETNPDALPKLMKLGKEVGDLKKKFPDGQITLEALTKVQEDIGKGTNLTLDNAIKQWDILSKLPKQLQFQAMITLSTLKTSESFDTIVQREIAAAYKKTNPTARRVTKSTLDAFAAANPDIKKKAEEAALTQIFGTALSGTEKNGNGSDSGAGKTKRDTSWLEDIAQRLKLVKESSLDATKALSEIRKFYGTKDNVNPMLAEQAGAIDQIRAAAKKAGIVLNEDFIGILKGMDPEQFNLWSKQLFTLGKKGRITGLKDDFLKINAALRTLTAGELIDRTKQENKEIQNQVTAYKILKDAKYSQLEIERILSDATMAGMIADQGFLSISVSERKDLNAEILKTIRLKSEESLVSLDKQIDNLESQVEAYDILAKKQVEQKVILEVLKNQNFVNAVVTGQGIDDIISKTQRYLDLLDVVAQKTKSQTDLLQEQIDENLAALDLQARELQNAFDLRTFQLKIDIEGARDAVNRINEKIQAEQDKIDDINLKIKYDPQFGDYVLEDLRERISDAQRVIEEQFDRPISALQDRSSVLSNDLAIMDKAAEAINEKYDKQEEALNKISQINQDIINQQKSQIGLADALTQGDISAAAKLAQDMRAQAADAASRTAGDVLAASRKAEIENLRSSSGMTRRQIEEEQFKISQKIFDLEQQRKINQAEILKLEDDLYRRQELREQATLAIREHEVEIDRLRKEELADAEKRLKDLEDRLKAEEDLLKKELDAIEKRKLEWEKAQIALDKYKQTLKKTAAAVLSMDDALKKVSDSVQLLNMSAKVAIDTGVLDPIDEKQLDKMQQDRKALIAEYDKLMAEYNAMPGGSDANVDRKAQFLETIQARFPQGRPEEFKRPASLTGDKKPITVMFKELNIEIKFFEEKMRFVRDYFEEIREDVEEIVENWDLIREDAETILTTIQELSALFDTLTPQVQAFKDAIAGLETPLENIATDTERTDKAFTSLVSQGSVFTNTITTIQGIVATLAGELEAAFAAVSAITKEIQSWDTTVTTRHVIEVEYKYLNQGPGIGAVPGSMYGGKIKNFNYGGKASYYNNGKLISYKPIGSDTVPAMLTPGEFVINKAASKEFYPLLNAINNSKFPSILSKNFSDGGSVATNRNMPTSFKNNFGQVVRGLDKGKGGIGGAVSAMAKDMKPRTMVQLPMANTTFVEPKYSTLSPTTISNTAINTSPITNSSNNVYNYSVGVNVAGTSVDAQSIARAVIDEIKYADSQRIRSIRS